MEFVSGLDPPEEKVYGNLDRVAVSTEYLFGNEAKSVLFADSTMSDPMQLLRHRSTTYFVARRTIAIGILAFVIY